MKKYIFLLAYIFTNSLLAQSTASKNVSTFEMNAPQLDTIRKIWVYLPEDYKISDKRYPVIYMHDAQNLFDASTSFVGEWKVDEFLDSSAGRKTIIVGIEHGNEKRIKELTPFSNDTYGGGEADAYLDFIRNTLKPEIDKKYRTLTDAANTTIMGSSLGGLVSFYAAVKYPDIFGNAGVFSPSFWFSEKIFSFTENAQLDENSRFFFLAGDAEGEEMVPDLKRMIALLESKGLPKQNFHVEIIEGGEHNEALWSAHFGEAFNWLMPGRSSKLIFKVKH